MTLRLLFCAAAIVTAVGCGKSADKAGKPVAPANIRQAGADVFITKPDGKEVNLTAESLASLTEQLRIFIVEQKRMPISFHEFANARLDSVPQPPAGFAWDLDRVSRQVIVVPLAPAK